MNKPPRKTPAAAPASVVEPMMTIGDVVAILRCDRRTLERLRASGRFPKPAMTIGRSPRWHATAVREWIGRGGDA